MAKINSSHIAIPTILKVEDGALSKIGPYLQESNLQKVVIYFGNGLIDMFGQKVLSSLHNAGIEVLEYCELDTVDIDDIIRIAFALPNSTQAVIGLGGGKVIDAAKYMGFLRKLPFISVPTSASSDGFSSASASLLINKRRSSVPARMAYGIIVDTDVIKSAPEKFLYSGIGDMVSKITSLYDWQFEAEHGAAQVNDFAMMIAKKAVNSFVRTPFETIHDRLFLKELLDSLSMSGIANEIAGSSAPTSGSEHLISHALDKMLETPQLHGIQVGIATYLMSRVHDHRYQRVNTIFTQTGFWDYVCTLNLNVEDYKQAIDLAPSIKPFRHTYLHEVQYRELAKQILVEDEYSRVLEKTGHYYEAVNKLYVVEQYYQEVKNEKKLNNVKNRIGLNLSFIGDIERATEYLESLLFGNFNKKIDRNNILSCEVANNLSLCYMEAGFYKKALRLQNSLYQLYLRTQDTPVNYATDILQNKGNIYLYEHKYYEAFKCFEQALNDETNPYSKELILENYLYAKGFYETNFEESITFFENQIRQTEMNYETCKMLAEMYFANQNYSKCAKLCKRVLNQIVYREERFIYICLDIMYMSSLKKTNKLTLRQRYSCYTRIARYKQFIKRHVGCRSPYYRKIEECKLVLKG